MTKHTSLTRDVVKRYLIAKVTRDERIAVEEALDGEEALNEFLVIEDQLVYDYLRGRLSVADHRLFESNYLNYSRSRREKVEVARALLEQSERLRMAERIPARERADLQTASIFNLRAVMTIVTLAVLTPLFLLLFMTRSQRTQLAEIEARHAGAEQQLRSEVERKEQELQRQAEMEQHLRKQYVEEMSRERAAAERLRAQLANALARPQLPSLSTMFGRIFLSGGVWTKGNGQTKGRVWTKGGGWIPEYVIGRRWKSLRLELELPTEREYASYSAKLSNLEGPELKSFADLPQKMTRRGPVAIVNISGVLLKPGTYTVKLYGSDPALGDKPIPLDSYFFSLKKK
jgi:hypothetical protein